MLKIRMMRLLVLIPVIAFIINTLSAQEIQSESKIDFYLIKGEYEKVVDTCKIVLSVDSLNHEIWYKLGLAYQNIIETDLAIDCFHKALEVDPENKYYSYMLAKGYYTKGRNIFAEPLFIRLLSADTLNWMYAYYLTAIYTQAGKYSDAARIYRNFVEKDPYNTVYLDKLGYANLKLGNHEEAIGLYSRSLAVNPRDVTALKNLAFLYASTGNPDTALVLLTRGIDIDPYDMDFYLSRAQVYFSRGYTKRAMDDYLQILAAGDTTVLYLKRVGIGYMNNLQYNLAIPYFLMAGELDPHDYEIFDNLGSCYDRIKDYQSSVDAYTQVVEMIKPAAGHMNYTYFKIAECQNRAGLFREAITNYMVAQESMNNPSIYMIIANLYDEKLHDSKNSVIYYQKYLDTGENSVLKPSPEYLAKIRERMEYLKKNPDKNP